MDNEEEEEEDSLHKMAMEKIKGKLKDKLTQSLSTKKPTHDNNEMSQYMRRDETIEEQQNLEKNANSFLSAVHRYVLPLQMVCAPRHYAKISIPSTNWARFSSALRVAKSTI